MVVVKADFSAGNYLGLGQQGVQFGQGVVIGFGCAVGIDAGARVEHGQFGAALTLGVELAADTEGLMHLGWTLADADGEHRAHACLEGAREHCIAVAGVALAVNMGMRIDQQMCLASCMGRTFA